MPKLKLNFQEQVLQQLTASERIQFVFFYRQQQKKLVIYYLWLIFLGAFGMHKFYLNNRSGWWYLLFCWTLIPSILALVDTFLAPFQLRKYNHNLSLTLFSLIKQLDPTAPNLLVLDTKLRRQLIGGGEWVIALLLIFMGLFPALLYANMRWWPDHLEFHYLTNPLKLVQSLPISFKKC